MPTKCGSNSAFVCRFKYLPQAFAGTVSKLNHPSNATTMEQKIKLKHPAGKKAVSMDKDKYDTLKTALLNQLKANGEVSHAELLSAVSKDLQTRNIKFAGSVAWHMEWVKLDLEARKEIRRVGESPVRFAAAK